MHACMHAHVCIYMCVCVYATTCLHTSMNAYMCVHVHVHTEVGRKGREKGRKIKEMEGKQRKRMTTYSSIDGYMHVCMYVCIYTTIHIYMYAIFLR